jgi:hypothetical protein
MTERPILFSAPMVRAILAGTKTQTRRVVKPAHKAWIEMPVTHQLGEWDKRPLPYGKTGDRLWVRETWQAVSGNDRVRHIMTHPRPDRGWLEYAATPRADEPAYKWRPSIHMPRWASRITLEVTGVRVERLQDISEADALAEGISRLAPSAPPHEWSGLNRFTLNGMGSGFCAGSVSWNSPTAEALYLRLWEDINGPGSWEANPWVWVVEFKRVQP